MNNLITKCSEKLRSQGRYGMDSFSRTLLIYALVFLMLSFIPKMWFFRCMQSFH